jgi:hypothetical protein
VETFAVLVTSVLSGSGGAAPVNVLPAREIPLRRLQVRTFVTMHVVACDKEVWMNYQALLARSQPMRRMAVKRHTTMDSWIVDFCDAFGPASGPVVAWQPSRPNRAVAVVVAI